MVITGEIDFSFPIQPHTPGGFANINPGQYKGSTVAVKTLRVSMTDNFDKIRKVSWNEILAVVWDDTEISPSDSVKRLSFGTRYPIPTS
jgi:hypothetical protein